MFVSLRNRVKGTHCEYCDLYLLPTCVIAKLCNKQVRRHFMTLIIENNSGHMSMRNSFSQSQPHSKVFHVAAPIFPFLVVELCSRIIKLYRGCNFGTFGRILWSCTFHNSVLVIIVVIKER